MPQIRLNLEKKADKNVRRYMAVLPLRIEIDSFFSFVREKKAKKDSYLSAPLLLEDELETKIRSTIEEWHDTEWWWLDNEIVPKR